MPRASRATVLPPDKTAPAPIDREHLPGLDRMGSPPLGTRRYEQLRVDALDCTKPAPPLAELPGRFRAEAQRAALYSSVGARVWKWAADEVERAIQAHTEEVLSITDAAAESGWHYEALRKRVVGDADINSGAPGAPAIRRGDLAKLGPPRRRRVVVPRTQPCREDPVTGSTGGAGPSSSNIERIRRHALRTG
jgi:hypothetical protein